MPSRVDLHTHTNASDGTLAPSALFDRAAELQIHWLAVSDHDSTAGFQAIWAERARHPEIALIPAIEMGAEGPYACHLLGYYVDVTSVSFQNQLAAYRIRRHERIQAMVEKLRALKLDIQLERVLEIAGGAALGRPHVADALREKGYVKSRQEAFDRYLKKDGPAYIPRDTPTAEELIHLLRSAGGIPVLAHPSYDMTERWLEQLIGFGLLGLEAYYPEHGRSLTQHYVELASKLNLVATGGSDFHGPRTGRAALGCVDVPEAVIENLAKAKNRL